MRIELKSLTFSNFKGIKKLQIKFGPITNIFGANATGKTTIFDGLTYLLFGKDSTDSTDFGIKTRNEQGNVIPQIDHEVLGQFMVDDQSLILRRVYKEIWRKPRGQAESKFSGHETIFYVDMVPVLEKEYKEKIDSLCKEAIFKLLTNPEYFPRLNWAVQRQALFSLTPNVTNEEIIATIPSRTKQQGNFNELERALQAKMELTKLKSKLAADKKKLQDELDLIPARIDEVERGKPAAEDWGTLEVAIIDGNAYIRRKEEEKSDKLKAIEGETDKRAKIRAEISNIEAKIKNIQTNTHNSIHDAARTMQVKIQGLKDEVSLLESSMERKQNMLSALRLDLEYLQAIRQTLLDEWNYYSKQEFHQELEGKCPTCGQDLPEDFKQRTLEENKKEWNISKQANLEANKKKGLSIAGQITEKNETIGNLVKAQNQLLTDLGAVKIKLTDFEHSPRSFNDLATELALNEDYVNLNKSWETLSDNLVKLGPVAPVDTSVLIKEISDARTFLQQNTAKLGKREQIEKADIRKKELGEQQKALSQQIAELEQVEFSIETFQNTQVTMLEAKINAMFSLVRFRMFDVQVNGQLDPTCECTVAGVPYSDLNNAMKINAGIDIINTMSKHHGIVAPIFIDNRESVNELIPTEAQLVNLYVIPEVPLDKEENLKYVEKYSKAGILLI